MSTNLTNNLFRRKGQNIYALATAMGGPVAVIRVSGDDLSPLANLFSDKKLPLPGTHKLKLLVDPKNLVAIDKALVLYFETPNSFTGENVIEIQCHGVASVVEKIFDALQSVSTIAALPGEFSFRAVLNNKIDLTQAEALNTALSSESISQSEATQLLTNSKSVNSVYQESLLLSLKEVQKMRGLLEAAIDFPEAAEEQAEFVDQVQSKLSQLKKKFSELQSAIENYAMKLSEPRIVIFGEPNVGKSTLFNLLVGGDRAIVSDIEGTTRDVIEAKIKLPRVGWVKILDTAGIRNTNDQLEVLGIEKGKEFLDLAILGVHVSKEGTEGLKLNSEIEEWKNSLNKKGLIAELRTFSKPESFQLNSEALDLKNQATKSKEKAIFAIEEAILRLRNQDIPAVFASQRQVDIVNGALAMTSRIEFELAEALPLEIVANSFRDLEQLLRNSNGEALGEEYISEIFSQFCLGK